MNQPKPRRFVPTLTDVVEGNLSVERLAFQPATTVEATREPDAHSPTQPPTIDDMVAAITATVSQQLDDLIRGAVATQLQAQQLLLVQHLRNDVVQSVEQMVRTAVNEQLAQSKRESL